MRKPLSIISVIVVLVFLSIGMLSSSVSAATLIIDSVSGKLMGASDVLVGSTYYDVTFVEGNFSSLTRFFVYGNLVFDFTSEDDAVAASQALLDQVFVDQGTINTAFDSDPSLTYGIESKDVANVWTPYDSKMSYEYWGSDIYLATAVNVSAGPYTDVAGVEGYPLQWGPSDPTIVDIDTGCFDTIVWATWDVSQPGGNPVPEPATMLLLGSGLVGLAGFRKKFKK